MNSLRFIAAASEYRESPEWFGDVRRCKEPLPPFSMAHTIGCTVMPQPFRQQVRKLVCDGNTKYSPFLFSFSTLLMPGGSCLLEAWSYPVKELLLR
jgi:hypothetical protein